MGIPETHFEDARKHIAGHIASSGNSPTLAGAKKQRVDDGGKDARAAERRGRKAEQSESAERERDERRSRSREQRERNQP